MMLIFTMEIAIITVYIKYYIMYNIYKICTLEYEMIRFTSPVKSTLRLKHAFVNYDFKLHEIFVVNPIFSFMIISGDKRTCYLRVVFFFFLMGGWQEFLSCVQGFLSCLIRCGRAGQFFCALDLVYLVISYLFLLSHLCPWNVQGMC